MDWVNEIIEKSRRRLKNMSLKRALFLYIVGFIVGTLALSFVTIKICNTWEKLVLTYYGEVSDIFAMVRTWCPYVYAVLSMTAVSMLFYRLRLHPPFLILQSGANEIKKNNLDFVIWYDSEDEMGQLCQTFEEMRIELIRNKEEMWTLIDEQKKLNAAFAHDLRTPLTVLRGYSDFLIKYLPEGKISEEKLISTLELMTDHIKRLEQYTNTMKNIHSIEDIPVTKKEIVLESVQSYIQDIVKSLDQIGFIRVIYEDTCEKEKRILADQNIILEVIENLISNAMRYAKNEVRVSMSVEKDKLYVYVEDDGTGFSKEDLINAVKPYYSGRQEWRTNHFGIGLYICRCLSEKHGGELSLTNRIEGGAIVTVSFAIN